jgi:hypothetical protein
LDLKAYFDNVQHDLLLEKVAKRVQDGEILHVLKNDPESDREEGRTARWGDIAITQQHLSHRGGPDAGKGD